MAITVQPDTPLLDELAELGDAGARVLAAAERLVTVVQAERAERRRAERRRELEAEVAGVLAFDPDATLAAVCRQIHARRLDIRDALAAVRRPVPVAGNGLG